MGPLWKGLEQTAEGVLTPAPGLPVETYSPLRAVRPAGPVQGVVGLECSATGATGSLEVVGVLLRQTPARAAAVRPALMSPYMQEGLEGLGEQ